MTADEIMQIREEIRLLRNWVILLTGIMVGSGVLNVLEVLVIE